MRRLIARGEGRIKTALRAKLAALGFEVHDFWNQYGAYTHVTWDLASWGGRAYHNGRLVDICSWNNMTDCVRYPLTFSDYDSTTIEFHAERGKRSNWPDQVNGDVCPTCGEDIADCEHAVERNRRREEATLDSDPS